jgi:hypothetical protein
MGQLTPVAAFKVDPAPAVAAGQPTTALGAVVGHTYTFILCEESGREMLCGLSPAPSGSQGGSQGGDTTLTAVGFATQERSQLLGSCLQFTQQVGDTPVLCTVGVTASMYTVELGDGSVQRVAGEELIRAYTSPAGTFMVRSLHALAVVDITPPRATHFVVGVADENGEVTELASWELDAASQPTLQELADAGEAVVLEVAGTSRLAQDSTAIDACIAQCWLEMREEEARLWGVLRNELAVCDNLGTFDTQTLDNIGRCSVVGTIVGGGAGAIIGGCVTGIPGGAVGGFFGCIGGPPGSILGFCVGFATTCWPGAIVGGGIGGGVGLAVGACVGWERADNWCRDEAWDRYELGLLNAAAAYDACRSVRCGG